MFSLRPILPLRVLLFFSTVLLGLVAQAQKSTLPEEIQNVGPGYITKGYKTIINGQVVQTTDGQTFEAVAQPAPVPAPKPQDTTPVKQGDWPDIVTIKAGIVVDPLTGAPINNMPTDAELIPLGLRKFGANEEMMHLFRISVKTPPPAETPASVPDTSPMAAVPESESESSEVITETEETIEEESGGFFDFLFGSSEEQNPQEKFNIDLSKPMTEAEIAALKDNPEFQEYLRERANSERNFSVSSKRGPKARGHKPKASPEVKVEEFDVTLWQDNPDFAAPTPPTPNISIGKLVSVDRTREIAVCWLQTRYLRPVQPMVTRNYELVPTGVIIPSGQQDGRSAGFWIAQGNPSPGDEVIVAGPDYAELVNPWIE